MAKEKAASSPLLLELFDVLKPLLEQHVPPFTAKAGKPTEYHLWSANPVVIEGRKFPELYFASIMIMSSYVGFYYFPIYACPDQTKLVQPELLKLLKGKTCFHIKKNDPLIFNQIADALVLGKSFMKARAGYSFGFRSC